MKIYEFFQDDKRLYIVTELLTGGELFDKILKTKHFNEKKAALYMKQILSAVAYCHSHHLVHRDLKLENLLLENSRDSSPLKVIDFGTSQYFNRDKKIKGRKGTPYYIAPEVLLNKAYDEKCDVWSCGIILYIFLRGSPPFHGKDQEDILEQVVRGKIDYNRPEFNGISHHAIDLLKAMTKYNPAKRCSSVQALNHPWFTSFEDKEALTKQSTINIMENLQRFRAYSKMEQAVYMYIATQLFTSKEKDELRSVFESMDTNHDGQLSKEELIEGYTKICGSDQTATKIVNEIMLTADPDMNGVIDYTEFIVASSNKNILLSEAKLRATFDMFDQV